MSKPVIAAIPQIRIRFTGDRPTMFSIPETMDLHDVMVSLSVPAARKLAKEIKAAIRSMASPEGEKP